MTAQVDDRAARLDEALAAASAVVAGPAVSDALEHALRSAAETLSLLVRALRADLEAGAVDEVHDALAGARATTEAVKFALASRGPAARPRHQPPSAPVDRPLA